MVVFWVSMSDSRVVHFVYHASNMRNTCIYIYIYIYIYTHLIKCLSFFILSLQKETTTQQFSHQPEEEFSTLKWLFQRDLIFQAWWRSQFRADFFCCFRCSHLTFLPENPASSATSAVPGKGSWRVANTPLFCATKTWDGLVCSRFSFLPFIENFHLSLQITI